MELLESLEEHEALALASYGPSSPRKKKTLKYPVLVHFKEVVDHGPLFAEDLPDEWLPNEGEDLTRTHPLFWARLMAVANSKNGLC